MKLSKTSRLVLSVGVFIVIFASLGVTRTQQFSQQDQLNEELSVIEKRLDNTQAKELHSQQENLQKQLDESIIQLAAAKDNFRQPNENISVIDEFFAIAEDCNVEVLSISASGLGSGMLADINCSTLTLGASVNGGVMNLISFITRLNNDFTTGIVGSAQLSGVSDNESAVSDNGSSAGIQMTVYSYKGG